MTTISTRHRLSNPWTSFFTKGLRTILEIAMLIYVLNKHVTNIRSAYQGMCLSGNQADSKHVRIRLIVMAETTGTKFDTINSTSEHAKSQNGDCETSRGGSGHLSLIHYVRVVLETLQHISARSDQYWLP